MVINLLMQKLKIKKFELIFKIIEINILKQKFVIALGGVEN